MRDALAVLVLAATAALPTRAQTPACDSLTGPKRALAEKLLGSEHPYECCDDTIRRCLEARPTCALAVRLAEDVCRRVASGQDEARVRRALSRRARSMLGGGAPVAIDLSGSEVAGPPDAPVTVTVYACARCPYCSKLVPELHAALAGRLKGLARLAVRTFPIKGHEGATEGGLAFVTAARMGRFWEYLLVAYRRFGEFAPEKLPAWAAEAGLDPARFTEGCLEPATRAQLVESKKEGIVNGVEETPTLFLNGRRWTGDLTLADVADAIVEEAERVRGHTWLDR